MKFSSYKILFSTLFCVLLCFLSPSTRASLNSKATNEKPISAPRETYVTLKYYLGIYNASKLAATATRVSTRAGLLSKALDEMATNAIQRASSMDDVAQALRGINKAIANVLESAGKCDLCLTRVETARPLSTPVKD